MNWIATNIRFPEDQYMELKMKAAKERKSVAAVIREAADIVVKPEKKIQRKMTEKEIKKFMRELDKLAEEISKEVPKDFDSVKALREIRYGI